MNNSTRHAKWELQMDKGIENKGQRTKISSSNFYFKKGYTIIAKTRMHLFADPVI